MSLPADYPRCKTCKWWKKRPGRIDGTDPTPRGVCYEAVVEDYSDTYKPDRIINDDDNCAVTGPDFGCLHHSGLSTTVPNDSQER